MKLPVVVGAFGMTALVMAVLMSVSFWILRSRPSAALYHALLFVVFYTVYSTMPGGFKKHFNVPADTPTSSVDIGYYTAVTHSGVGYGDIYPITTAARTIVSLHILLVVLSVFNILPFATK